MLKNRIAHVRKRGIRWIGFLVWGWIVCWMSFCGSALAQSSDASTTVLRFKIPPSQPSPTSTVPPLAPTPSAGASAPVIDETPASSTEKPSSAPSELSHEVLSPQTSPSKPTKPQPEVTGAGDASVKSTPSAKSSTSQQPPPATKPSSPRGGSVTAPSSKTLISLEIQKDDPAGEALQVALSGFFPPQVNAAEGATPRIICDFPEVALGKGVPKVLPVNGKFITQVRIGLHTQPMQKVRIVLDLVPEHNYDVEQFFYQKENLYKLLVKKRP